MRKRLSCIIVPDILNSIYFLDEKYWKNVDFNDPKREKHENDKIDLMLNINVENNTENVIKVSTSSEGVNTYLNNEKINTFSKKYPNLIIELMENQQFICSCRASLNLGMNTFSSSCVRNCYHTFDDETNTYTLNIMSNNQLDEFDILKKACKNIIHRLNILKSNILSLDYENISRLDDDKSKSELNNLDNENTQFDINIIDSSKDSKYKNYDIYIITFTDEDLTFPALLSAYLQDEINDVIKFAGHAEPSRMVKKSIIKIIIKKGNIGIILEKVINKIIALYEELLKLIKK
jgi:DNA-directed RNA polymerase subunit L